MTVRECVEARIAADPEFASGLLAGRWSQELAIHTIESAINSQVLAGITVEPGVAVAAFADALRRPLPRIG